MLPADLYHFNEHDFKRDVKRRGFAEAIDEIDKDISSRSSPSAPPAVATPTKASPRGGKKKQSDGGARKRRRSEGGEGGAPVKRRRLTGEGEIKQEPQEVCKSLEIVFFF